MGQAKLRGTFEERQKESVLKQELQAWRINELLDIEFEKVKKWTKDHNKRFSITKSEFVNRMEI